MTRKLQPVSSYMTRGINATSMPTLATEWSWLAVDGNISASHLISLLASVATAAREALLWEWMREATHTQHLNGTPVTCRDRSEPKTDHRE